jgi:hypothetical protein
MATDPFDRPNPPPSIRKTPVKVGDEVELQHEQSKLFLSKFGRWYVVGGDLNRDILPPELGKVPFPVKIASVGNRKRNGASLESGDWVRLRTTQSIPKQNLTMIGVQEGQNWSLCKHWGEGLVQFYFTEDVFSEWQIHRVAGPGAISYGDVVTLQKKHDVPSEAGWLIKSLNEYDGAYHAELALLNVAPNAPPEARWVIYSRS